MKKRRSFLRRGSKARAESLDAYDGATAAAAADAIECGNHHDNDDEPSSVAAAAVAAAAAVDPKQPQTIIATEPLDDNVLDTSRTHHYTVQQACEEIWKCQEPLQAAMWLEHLHHALLKSPLDSYVPADVFLCISGAAHCFSTSTQEHHDDTVLQKQVLWEEAMWAVAALARVCVGTAWRLQLRQRQEWVKCRKQQHDEDVHTGSDGSSSNSTMSPKVILPRKKPVDVVISTDFAQNPRSYSSMTCSSLANSSFIKTDKSYPSIPENLPGAMLRFATAMETFLAIPNSIQVSNEQTWIDQRKSLAEAQRELVLALCYIVPEEQDAGASRRLEWTILEAHEPVASMVRSWLESAFRIPNLNVTEKNDDASMSNDKPAAKPSDQSEEDASSRISIGSKSTQSIRNTTMVANENGKHNETVPSKQDSSRERQLRLLCLRISSGDIVTSDIDWWTTLQVVRAQLQLVSTGWRIPQNEIGEEIIAYCIGILEQGILLRAPELKSYGTEPGRVAREERLAASSSAITAVSVLSAIASAGLLPIRMQQTTIKVLCRIQLRISFMDTSVREVFPRENFLDTGEEEDWKADYETFMEQREDCVSDIVSLYWVLLAHSSSAAAAMSTFVEMMSFDEGDSFENGAVASMLTRSPALLSARIALDAVSGAVWGKPPDVPGISNLRIYWYEVLSAMRNLSLCVHEQIVEIDRAWDDLRSLIDERRHFVQASLSLLLEVIVSLKRFVHQELLRGECLLAPDEWDAFIEILDKNIDKWLCMTDKTVAFAAETCIILDIRSEVGTLLDSLRNFFTQCVQFESSPFNIVVEDECRVKLYSILLQKATPYMPPEKGISLALAVLQSWAATGFAIYRSDQWARTASYIITDVFSVFQDQSFGLYQGNVHAPSVRLEALRLIALGEEDEQRLVDPEQFDMAEHVSPLEQSLHLREQYLALVNSSLLPPLMNLFGAKASNIHVAVVIPLPFPSFSSRDNPANEDIYGNSASLDDTKLSIKADEHELRQFAVKLLGRLYRNGTGAKYRSSLLKTMLTAAINTSMDDFRIPAKPCARENDGETDSLITGKSQPSLQAIQELEKCMCLPFGSSPNAHECLPPVVDALSSVLIVYGGDPLKERGYYDESWLAVKRCIAIAAILPLSRLGVDYENKLLLDKPRSMARLVPEEIALRLVGEHGEGSPTTRREDIKGLSYPECAPFIAVSGDHRHGALQSGPKTSRSTNERTILSFIAVFSSILATLHTNLESKAARDKVFRSMGSESSGSQFLETLDSKFRALCYDELGAFVRSGVDFPFARELIPILQIPVVDVSIAEISARCQCASSVIESLAVRLELKEGAADVFYDDAVAILRLLLNFCRSSKSADVYIGCQSLRGLASFIATNSGMLGHLVFDVLSDRLKVEVERLRDGTAVSASCFEELSVLESLVSVLYDILCASTEHVMKFPSSAMILQTYDACCDVCTLEFSNPTTAKSTRLLCVRLVGILLNKIRNMGDEVTVSLVFEKITVRWINWAASKASVPGKPQIEVNHVANCSYSMILGDLVVQKLLSERDESSISDCALMLSYHELMAKETDDITRFVVEDASLNQEAPYAAWLCGANTLLTFRLGSAKSRYRGWLEILIRAPTRRTRRLIRLPNSISLDSPEIPSSLWNDPTRRLDSESATQAVSDEMTRHFTEPSDEMRKAVSVMKKFDEIFGTSSNKSQECGHNITFGRKGISLSQSKDFNENTASIGEWLHLVLKDALSVRCVVDELNSLGFSREMVSSAMTLEDDDIISRFLLPIERLVFTPRLERAISIVDRIPPFGSHKIALLFASDAMATNTNASEQSLEDTLLSSTAGSPKFLSFTEGLGELVLTRHLKYFSGGLDISGFDSDGKLSVIWLDRDDSFVRTMAFFHVVPFMPAGANNRKRHVGNDTVHIVYVEPASTLDQSLRRKSTNADAAPSVVSGQFCFVTIFVQTLTRQGPMKVSIRLRDGLAEGIQSGLRSLVGDHLVSETAAPAFVRQVAIRADMCCSIIMQDHLGLLNWEERQSQLASMRRQRSKKSS